ncbi:MAG: FecR family protein [Candidatus Binatia bacterium]
MSTRHLLTALLCTALAAGSARAETQVATFASATGEVQVQRGARGEWQPALVGNPVFSGDSVRTGEGTAAAKLVFVDDAVVDLASGTELAIERYAGTKGPRISLLRLVQGAIEALVAGYGEGGARYEVETPTAVVRVQGTVFVVRYDPTAKVTEVLGVDGTVAVAGRTGLIGPGAVVGPNQTTRIQRGKFPTPVETVDAAAAAPLLAGLRTVGSGQRDSLAVDNPQMEGRIVSPEDRPTLTAAAAEAGYLRPGAPGETLINTLSPDIRANTQSLPVYRAVPPNESPAPPR